jgi:hypothetical protein
MVREKPGETVQWPFESMLLQEGGPRGRPSTESNAQEKQRPDIK